MQNNLKSLQAKDFKNYEFLPKDKLALFKKAKDIVREDLLEKDSQDWEILEYRNGV